MIFIEELVQAERLMDKGFILDEPESRAEIVNLINTLPKGQGEDTNRGRCYTTRIISSREDGVEHGYKISFYWNRRTAQRAANFRVLIFHYHESI